MTIKQLAHEAISYLLDRGPVPSTPAKGLSKSALYRAAGGKPVALETLVAITSLLPGSEIIIKNGIIEARC